MHCDLLNLLEVCVGEANMCLQTRCKHMPMKLYLDWCCNSVYACIVELTTVMKCWQLAN